MSEFNFSALDKALESTLVVESGVSFLGKALKLDNEESAKDVIDAITKCKDLVHLNLEGNTLGVDAAAAIAKALKTHPEFKKALWKDLFTGRMKEEIPKALEHLGNGMIAAGARLSVLDLSDNAFGPNGMEGLSVIIKSSTCYALEELRLNNNGLGIGGGRMLAEGLLQCHAKSKAEGKPLSLKVFVAGRNRLENEGAKALAQVFKTIGTLEEISMPQNGIYHVGISALSDAFTYNRSLRVLNLNDNTIGPKGAQELAKALGSLQQLQEINFGDCLLKTSGATTLANALKSGHSKLEVLILGFNEIGPKGAMALEEAVRNKEYLKTLGLDGNQFGEECRGKLTKALEDSGRRDALASLSEDESEEDEEIEEDDSQDEDGDEESQDEYPEAPVIKNTLIEAPQKQTANVAAAKFQNVSNILLPTTLPSSGDCVNVEQFFSNPSIDNFVALGENRIELINKEIKVSPADTYIERTVPILMKVSSLSISSNQNVHKEIFDFTKNLYKELIEWAKTHSEMPKLNNVLLVNMSLIKSEDKKFRPIWNVEGCYHAFESIISEAFVPAEIRESFKLFLEREDSPNISFSNSTKNAKEKLLKTILSL